MKKVMESKFKNKGGFTLVELLIVVAIIAILIAVSIPVVNSTLEKAREATDAANERAAAGAIVTRFLSEDISANTAYYYAVDKSVGKLKETKPTDATFKYGKGTASGDVTDVRAGKGIKIQIDTNGDVSSNWE